ncbi:MAG: hypothetical protein ABSF93_13580 [Candidatus Sulfotelmatobacter sp.]|jgi:hypothetical protein
MHLALQNAETINRLVEQGELLLKSFHDEHQKDPQGVETEFARGELVGWRCTLHTLYRDCAEDIVTRVITRTRLAIPDGDVPSGATHEAILHEVERLRDVSERLAILAGQHPHGSWATDENPVADHHYFG